MVEHQSPCSPGAEICNDRARHDGTFDARFREANLQRKSAATLPGDAARCKLLTEARAKKVLVVYSFVAGGAMADTLPDVAPNSGEPAVQAGPNKFLNTDLEKILKDHGITTVIVTGTAAHGAVLHTGAEAIFRGFKAIVPVDTMSAENTFVEQYVAYDFVSAPRLSAATTLTRVGMMKF